MNISIVLPFFHKADLFRLSLPLNDCYRSSGTEVVCVLDDPNDVSRVMETVRQTKDVRFRVIVNDWEHDWRPPCIPINVGIRHAKAGHVVIASPESVISLPNANYLEQLQQEDYRCAWAGLLWNLADAQPKDSPQLLRQKMIRAEGSQSPKAIGCGFLMAHKHEIEQICGLNEARAKYGGDDDEIRYRLVRFGVRLVIDPCIKVFHPWHETKCERALNDEDTPHIVLTQQKEIWGTAFGRVVWDWEKQ